MKIQEREVKKNHKKNRFSFCVFAFNINSHISKFSAVVYIKNQEDKKMNFIIKIFIEIDSTKN